MFQQLRNASVLTRARCFPAKTSECLLNFADLWNENMKLKNPTLYQTYFILFSNGL